MEQPLSGPRVAFFGGSFDPPHLGHLAVADAARTALRLDTVLFAPVGAQPLKPHGSTASFEDRLAMTRLAIAGELGLDVTLADSPKPSNAPNFTIETLEALRTGLAPGGTLFCLMGADSFLSLRRWHRSEEIPFIAPLIVASRPGQSLDGIRTALPSGLTIDPAERRANPVPSHLAAEFHSSSDVQEYLLSDSTGQSAPFYLMPGLHVEISASRIRDRVRAAADVSLSGPELLPRAVLEYIQSHGLYR